LVWGSILTAICTDLGGFLEPPQGQNSQEYIELLLRWFHYGAFSPVFRIHGKRSPNEVWSYGDEDYTIMSKYLKIREKLKPYLLKHMRIAHEEGITHMRPLFMDFEDDATCYEKTDQYMLGSDMLICPVTEYGARQRDAYLPNGKRWTSAWTGEEIAGGQWITVDAPLDRIPLFVLDHGLCDIVKS